MTDPIVVPAPVAANPVLLTTPVVLPAVASQTFNEIYCVNLAINSPPNGKTSINASLVPAYTDPTTANKVLLSSQKKNLIISDFFGTASDAELAVANQLVSLLKARAGI